MKVRQCGSAGSTELQGRITGFRGRARFSMWMLQEYISHTAYNGLLSMLFHSSLTCAYPIR